MASSPLDDLKNWKLWAGMFVLVLGGIFLIELLGLTPDPPPGPDEVLDALELPEPPAVTAPVLAGDLAAGTTIRTLCLDTRVRSRGSAEMETTIRIGNRPVDSIEERTAAMLSLAGIELATTGCDALLHVEAVGGRATASYTGIGICGVGIDIDGEATIEVSGETRTWTLAREAPPPPTALSACPSRPNDAIPASSWYHDLVVGPLADVFGPRIEAAAWMTQAMEQDHPRVPDQAASTIALEGLRGEYGEDALGLVASWVQEHPDHELLGDLVPYLIEGFASHPDDADFHWVLSHITGEQLENGRPTYDWEPGDWYEWWIEQ